MLTRRGLLKGLVSSLAAAAAGSLTRASEVMPPQIQQPMLRASRWIRGRYVVRFNRVMVPQFTFDVSDTVRQLPDLRAVLSENRVKDMATPSRSVRAVDDRRGFWHRVLGRRADRPLLPLRGRGSTSSVAPVQVRDVEGDSR